MRFNSALLALEFAYTAGLLLFITWNYVNGTPIDRDMFFSFVFYPMSVLAMVLVFSYYISVKFGKSIIAYGVVLGLAISLLIFAARVLPPVLTLGLAIFLINRLVAIASVQDIKQLGASFVADHLVSFQIASLILLAMTREYSSIFEKGTVSAVMLVIIISWYLFTLFYDSRALSRSFINWSRSE